MGNSSAATFRILLIGGGTEQLERTCRLLEQAGYQVSSVAHWREAAGHLTRHHPDLLMWCQSPGDAPEAAGSGAATPLLLPTLWIGQRPRHSESDAAAEDGLAGWLPCPFEAGELLEAVRRLLPRSTPVTANERDEGGSRVSLDADHRRCVVHNVLVRLSPTEFRLLAALVRNPNQVLSQRELLRQVWGPEYLGTSTSDIVRQAVRSLRMKLKRQQLPTGLVETVRGQGYVYRWPHPLLPEPELDEESQQEEWAND